MFRLSSLRLLSGVGCFLECRPRRACASSHIDVVSSACVFELYSPSSYPFPYAYTGCSKGQAATERKHICETAKAEDICKTSSCIIRPMKFPNVCIIISFGKLM